LFVIYRKGRLVFRACLLADPNINAGVDVGTHGNVTLAKPVKNSRQISRPWRAIKPIDTSNCQWLLEA
jgi:hypothetical protein